MIPILAHLKAYDEDDDLVLRDEDCNDIEEDIKDAFDLNEDDDPQWEDNAEVVERLTIKEVKIL